MQAACKRKRCTKHYDSHSHQRDSAPQAVAVGTLVALADATDMVQCFGGRCLRADAADPHDAWPRDVAAWFRARGLQLVTLHASGTDALNAALAYAALPRLRLRRRRTPGRAKRTVGQEAETVARSCRVAPRVLHAGFYGAFYGPLLASAAPFITRMQHTGAAEPLLVPIPCAEHDFTAELAAVQEHFMRHRAPMPDAALPPLTQSESACVDAARAAFAAGDVDALLIEAVSHAGDAAFGVRLVRELARAARSCGVTVVADEVMLGVRCGATLFAHEFLGVAVDVVVFGKAFGVGGVALRRDSRAAIVRCPPRVVPTSFVDGAVLSVLRAKLAAFTPALLAHVALAGAALREHLRGLIPPRCTHERVTGVGLLVATNVPLAGVHMLYGRLLPILDIREDEVRALRRAAVSCGRC